MNAEDRVRSRGRPTPVSGNCSSAAVVRSARPIEVGSSAWTGELPIPADVDVLVFDIQDIGARFYTYIWTLYYAMQAAGENGADFLQVGREAIILRRLPGRLAHLARVLGLPQALTGPASNLSGWHDKPT